MYLSAPKWRGTSPVFRLQSASQVRGGLFGLGRGRGLGDIADPLPPCSSVTVAPGFVGPINCDPTLGLPKYPASQSQLLSSVQGLQAEIDALASSGAAAAGAGSGVVSWLNTNAGYVALAGGGLLVLMALSGRSR